MIKKIVLPRVDSTTRATNDLNICNPVFAKYNGHLRGMVIKEERGWILRVAMNCGAYGYFPTLQECVEAGITKHDYEFFIDVEA